MGAKRFLGTVLTNPSHTPPPRNARQVGITRMREKLINRREDLPVLREGTSAKDRDVSSDEMRARMLRLTSRERQVMHLIVRGLKSREMATQLGISARTIEAHRAHIMLKMGTKLP